MADKHRRVEPRQIVGTGMATDPRRVEDLQEEQARRERAWRDAPEKAFGAVLEETPAKAQAREDDVDEDPRRRRRREEEERAKQAALDAARVAAATDVAAAPAAEAPPAPTKRVPPDPREALLRKALAARAPTKASSPHPPSPSPAGRGGATAPAPLDFGPATKKPGR